MKTPRYIPENATLTFETSKGVIYTYADPAGNPCAIGYFGTSSKPWFRYRYPSIQGRSEAIQLYVESLKRAEIAKENEKAARKARAAEFRASLKPGVILTCSWGWEQTNVEFYRVIRVEGFKVTLEEIYKKQVEATSWAAAKVVANLEGGSRAPETFKLSPLSTSIKVNSSISLTVWDGRPTYCSWYA